MMKMTLTFETDEILMVEYFKGENINTALTKLSWNLRERAAEFLGFTTPSHTLKINQELNCIICATLGDCYEVGFKDNQKVKLCLPCFKIAFWHFIEDEFTKDTYLGYIKERKLLWRDISPRSTLTPKGVSVTLTPKKPLISKIKKPTKFMTFNTFKGTKT